VIWPTQRVRGAAVAAGLAGAFLLTACGGGDSGSGGGSSAGTATAAPSGAASADTGGGDGDGGGGSGVPTALEGSWLATTGGKAVALVVTGDRAGLFATGGTVCSGTAADDSGTPAIKLTCTDGDKDRASGVVSEVDDKTLKMIWESDLGEETFTKSEGGTLPTELATGLPTGQ
jgi:hypothetical protein